jgi:hypothetical protein
MFEKSVTVVIDDNSDSPISLIIIRTAFLLYKDYVIGYHLTKMFVENKTTKHLVWYVVRSFYVFQKRLWQP